MVDDKGSHSKAMFPNIFADYQNPPLTWDVAMANKAWQIWQNTPFSWWQCQLNFALWCASAGCGVSSKRRSPFLPACTASTSSIRPGACLKSCVSPSRGINLILGMRTHITRGPTSGFALSLGYRQIRNGSKSWITDVKISDLGVPSWLHLGRIDMRMWRKANSSTRKMCHNNDISGAWTTFVLDKSEGFTHADVERLNDSIRTYVWAILGAQAQTRSNILVPNLYCGLKIRECVR